MRHVRKILIVTCVQRLADAAFDHSASPADFCEGSINERSAILKHWSPSLRGKHFGSPILT